MTALHGKIKFEKCVVCHCTTETPMDTPVSLRKNYIIGVGELCDNCYLEVYSTIEPVRRSGE